MLRESQLSYSQSLLRHSGCDEAQVQGVSADRLVKKHFG